MALPKLQCWFCTWSHCRWLEEGKPKRGKSNRWKRISSFKFFYDTTTTSYRAGKFELPPFLNCLTPLTKRMGFDNISIWNVTQTIWNKSKVPSVCYFTRRKVDYFSALDSVWHTIYQLHGLIGSNNLLIPSCFILLVSSYTMKAWNSRFMSSMDYKTNCHLPSGLVSSTMRYEKSI